MQIAVPWSDPGSRFTALLEALVIDWLKEAVKVIKLGMDTRQVVARFAARIPLQRQLLPIICGKHAETPCARSTPEVERPYEPSWVPSVGTIR